MKISIICPKDHVLEHQEEAALVIDIEGKAYSIYCPECGSWYRIKMCIEENCPIFHSSDLEDNSKSIKNGK